MASPILQPEDQVLSTLKSDGTRRWLKPKLSKGKLLVQRRVLAYILIAVFTVLPFIKIGGKPLVLLDITSRRFTIFGFTFLPTDSMLLAIFVVGLLLGIFLLTALFGRVWCGWACPQTVYMEFLFRPVERFFDGTAGRGGNKKNVAPWRIVAKYIVYFVLCVYLANTFLAYFIGVDRLSQWVTQSPFEHPIPFAVMAAVTFAMMVDFCFFREQMCLIACPYGRFQSVLLDQNSLIVAYHQERGEPRGKLKKSNTEEVSKGDCIDCRNCVTTCPTGIDIRDGLQMECINCTQCIDACNLVMEKIGLEPNLIRYSSQSKDAGKTASLLRARTVIYPLLLCGIAVAFFTVFLSSKTFDAITIREPGVAFTISDEGKVRNIFRLKITNRTDETMSFSALMETPESSVIEVREDELTVEPNKSVTFHIAILAPKESFKVGRTPARIILTNQKDVSRILSLKLIGPFN